MAVKSIREVRPGKNTEVLKSNDITGMFSEDCTFSIIFGDEFESIDLIALVPEDANIWVTGLNFLIGLIKCKYFLGLCHCLHKYFVFQLSALKNKNNCQHPIH